MDEKVFYIVDVFAEEQYSGNQLAVFLNGHLYSDDEMQRLAKEMNFSESTFHFPHESSRGLHRVRIFTPAEELPFAGHPTLGTAFVIASRLYPAPPAEAVLALNAGEIPVKIELDAAGQIGRLTMKQLQPQFGPTLDPEPVARMLGLPPDALDARYPAEDVSTGVHCLIVPLVSRAALEAIRVAPDLVAEALAPFSAKTVLAFCRETYEQGHDLNARVFAPLVGVAEDPATGSAGGCLTAYLLRHRYFGGDSLDIRLEQGYQMGRKSLLYLAGSVSDGGFEIYVGGRVQPVAECRIEP
ncbi:MAG: PhzF family phenazine biosynthesis protein [Chloroflexia bacterium]